MKYMDMPSLEYLRECLVLNKKTGVLRWRRRPLKHFKRRADWISWNKRIAKKVAGCPKGNGYLVVRICGRNYHAHRLVYTLHHGADPGHIDVDHKYGQRADNRPRHLRLLSRGDNVREGFKRRRK